ncbi:MAG: phage holin family protein [Angustibacter sp.]
MSAQPDSGFSDLDAREQPSIGRLIGEINQDLSTLIHQELDLVKAEAKQSATRAGTSAGLFAGAATTAQLAVVFFSVAAWWGLGNALGRGWAGLVVAATWTLVAVVLALAGKKTLSTVRGLARTTETVGQIPAALSGHEERNR